MDRKITVSILGCGWYGLPVGTLLAQEGYIIKGSTTRREKLPILAAQGIIPYILELKPTKQGPPSGFFKCDVLIIAFPPRISNEGVEGYLKKIKYIIDESRLHRIQNVIFISSSSVYGSPGIDVTETTPIGPDTASGQALCQAEALLKENGSFNTTILRFAGLVGPGRHPGLFFKEKGEVGNGRAPVNLVHLSDCIGLTEQIIREKEFGHILNVCAPDHPSRKAFYTLASREAGRPAPYFTDELKEWKTVSSVMIPATIRYHYRIQHWLEELTNPHNWHSPLPRF